MLVVLSNVLEDLEDPFDGIGRDHLNMEMIKEPAFLMFKRTRADVREMKKRENRIFHEHQQRRGRRSRTGTSSLRRRASSK